MDDKKHCNVHGWQEINKYYLSFVKSRTLYRCILCKRQDYYKTKEAKLEYSKSHYKNLRLKILRHYSESFSCDICGEQNKELLCLDHIFGDGNTHRKEVGKGYSLYKWIVNNNFPPIFRVLCYNCNFEHYIENNKSKKERKNELGRAYTQKQKKEVIDHYGGICCGCSNNNLNVLSIDHINNDGNVHRRDPNIPRGQGFYWWLKKNNFPSGYQVLCINCNMLKHLNNI